MDVQTGFIDRHKKEEIVICGAAYHVYILSGEQQDLLHQADIADTWMLSICVRATSNQGLPEIIIGSEDKKLFIYGHDLKKPLTTIPMEEGVRIVRAHTPTEENTPEIVVASLRNRIYAYKRNGKLLWSYTTHDRIKTMCIKDINGDGQAEILVGSEDRNIHVLDNTGHLLWRYYLPHSALTIDAADADHDDMVEVFVGCADGNLYVFNREGDLLWTYQAKDRIHAVRIEDIDGDDSIEIAIGAEDEFELLRVINQQQIASTIIQCWTELCDGSSIRDAIEFLLKSKESSSASFRIEQAGRAG